MGGLSLWHWLVVGVIILLLFGKGRFSDMMGDVAKGLKSFKKGMTDEDEAKAEAERNPPPPPRLDDRTSRPIDVMPERPAVHDHLGDAPIDQPPVRPEERREP